MSLVALLKKKTNKTLFTTPSHSGRFCILHKFYQWYRSDISEIDALNPQEALSQAEEIASRIYSTKHTKFLTNGSSSGVISAILASKPRNILIWEKAHPCHKNGAILANANIIEYSLSLDEELGVYKAISVEKVKELLSQTNADTLVITTPTYEGFVADIKEISNICKAKGVILIADEAHGALYPFSEELPESAIKHADFTIQSLHKTAGGLNPTALLHSNNIDPTEALKMISTTSPSYPMLASIEANIKFLNSSKGKNYIKKLIKNIKDLEIPQLNDDITKILLKGGEKTSEFLFDNYGIEDERTNLKTTMLLCGIGTDIKKLQRLKKALTNLSF